MNKSAIDSNTLVTRDFTLKRAVNCLQLRANADANRAKRYDDLSTRNQQYFNKFKIF
jgi:hypothetical protein